MIEEREYSVWQEVQNYLVSLAIAAAIVGSVIVLTCIVFMPGDV